MIVPLSQGSCEECLRKQLTYCLTHYKFSYNGLETQFSVHRSSLDLTMRPYHIYGVSNCFCLELNIIVSIAPFSYCFDCYKILNTPT